jgi:hypothetical protein
MLVFGSKASFFGVTKIKMGGSRMKPEELEAKVKTLSETVAKLEGTRLTRSRGH